jgi:DMSO/TMAO reductase YedYZ molybdopterin-dependent catalytic subunit
MKKLIFNIIIIIILFSFITACSIDSNNRTTVENAGEEILKIIDDQKEVINDKDVDEREPSPQDQIEPAYLSVYEGLHVTGNPIEVDIETYRLKITGAVDEELNLTFDDIKSMEPVREGVELVCPGFFVDYGYWTGVTVADLLELAGVKEGAKTVEFISIDNSYYTGLPIEKVMGEGFFLAYEFDDKEFSKYHGYPLRLVAKGEAGSHWVKWLGEVRVTYGDYVQDEIDYF